MVINLPSALNSQALSAPETAAYLNHYRCPVCQSEWHAEWACGCNDRCPTCHREITPYASVPLSGANDGV